MELSQTRVRLPHKAKLALAGAVCVLAAALPSLAAADSTTFGGSAGASLAFASGSARVLGSQALVLVRCLGPRSANCTGTVTLVTAGHEHKAPFSVIGGARQALVVPIGSDSRSARRALALARTVQSGGGFARASEILHLRR